MDLSPLSSSLSKISRLGWFERWILIQAILFLPLVRLALWFLNFQRLQGLLGKIVPSPADESEASIVRADAIARMVNVAVHRGPFRNTCLHRSLVLWYLLRRWGIANELHIGVRKQEGRLEAHAWVEIMSVPVNESPDIRQHYASFNNPILSGEATS
jgi:hypothetical protein